MVNKKAAQWILCGVLGIATLATFFASEVWTKEFLGSNNLMRISLYAAFFASIFWILNTGRKNETTDVATPNWARVLMVLLPMLAVVFAMVNALFPHVSELVRMGDNDIFMRPGAMLRMLFELVSCGIFLSLLPRFVRQKQWIGAVVLGMLVIVLFVMGMEEISWGQRVFQWQTTAYFTKHNVQGETNLHNLNTQLFQNVLFFGGFVLLAALPFFYQRIAGFFTKISVLKPMTVFLPELWMLVAFSAGLMFVDPFMATYGLHWGSICFQLIATIVLVVAFIVNAQDGEQFRLGLWALVCSVAVLALSLSYRELWMLNQGLPTEYIKTFINFGILCWAVRARQRLVVGA